MSDQAARPGLIGPNAVLQLISVMEHSFGPARAAAMAARAGIETLPDGSEMIPEGEAARLHHLLRITDPDRAPDLLAEAGRRTADYILAHRIPRPAQRVLRLLPAPLAARALSRAIAAHAWTFAGSGAFTVVSPWRFEIARNPLIAGEESAACLCHWHAAVFARLYGTLVHPASTCQEVACGSQRSTRVCAFQLSR